MNVLRTDILKLLPAMPHRNDEASMGLTTDEISRIGMLHHRSWKGSETMEIDEVDAALLARFNPEWSQG